MDRANAWQRRLQRQEERHRSPEEKLAAFFDVCGFMDLLNPNEHEQLSRMRFRALSDERKRMVLFEERRKNRVPDSGRGTSRD